MKISDTSRLVFSTINFFVTIMSPLHFTKFLAFSFYTAREFLYKRWLKFKTPVHCVHLITDSKSSESRHVEACGEVLYAQSNKLILNQLHDAMTM